MIDLKYYYFALKILLLLYQIIARLSFMCFSSLFFLYLGLKIVFYLEKYSAFFGKQEKKAQKRKAEKKSYIMYIKHIHALFPYLGLGSLFKIIFTHVL